MDACERERFVGNLFTKTNINLEKGLSIKRPVDKIYNSFRFPYY